MHAKRIVRLEIFDGSCSVDGDARTRCDFRSYEGKGWERFRRMGNLREKDMFEIGKDLFHAVSASGRRNFPPDEKFTLHIVCDDDEVRNLPWELLNTTGDVDGFLIRQGRFTVVRIKPRPKQADHA